MAYDKWIDKSRPMYNEMTNYGTFGLDMNEQKRKKHSKRFLGNTFSLNGLVFYIYLLD